MIISFTGAQSTGKSTLLEYCCVNDLFRNFHCVKEVTRKVARERQVDINELGADETQLYIMAEHLFNHNLKTDALLDRCILDGLVYTRYLWRKNNVSDWVMDYTTELYKLLVNKIDIIIYPDPGDVKLVKDGTRSEDVQFRDEIIQLFEEEMSKPIVSHKVCRVSGSVTDRYNQIKLALSDVLI